jgi:hypothetical protein
VSEPTNVTAERVIAAPAGVVERVLREPALYPRWVEGLRSFEAADDGTYVAEFGYLAYRKVARVAMAIDDGRVEWRRIGGNTKLLVRLSAEPAGGGASRAVLDWTVSGSGFLFGQYSSSPVFRAALDVMAGRSLGALERVATGEPSEVAS